MDVKLQDIICDKFSFIKCDIECGDGWYNLILNLCESIEKDLKEINDFEVLQIKEKYGRLRFYTTHVPEHIFQLIREAESQSQLICEVCGDKGEKRKTTWIFTRCDKCQNK